MIDRGVKQYLKQRGFPPEVFYGGLPRLVCRWKKFCSRIDRGSIPIYDGFRSLIGMRSQIHYAIAHATRSTIISFRDDIFDADKLLLSCSTCFVERIGKSSASVTSEQHWWLHCKPNHVPTDELRNWPDPRTVKSFSPTKYDPTKNENLEQEPGIPTAIAKQAQFMVQNGELQTHCVGELKCVGLDADVNGDWKIDTPYEHEVLVDIVTDLISEVSIADRKGSADGRECYFYQRRKYMLMLIFDPEDGGTAFIPVLGRRSFDAWNGDGTAQAGGK